MTTQSTRDALPPFPGWLPHACIGIFLSIANSCRSEKERKILRRLVTDRRMQVVWRELTKRDRGNGNFFYQAQSRTDKPSVSQDDDQDQALSELFHFAYCAARDERSTSTLDEAMDRKRELTTRAAVLRECAEMRRQDLLVDSQAGVADAGAVVRVAEWLEDISKDIRSIGDPLLVQRHRGNPTADGVASEIGIWLSNRFGKRLDRIAATLASVALGEPASPRAVRSALARTK
jgi:hypothetical protein